MEALADWTLPASASAQERAIVAQLGIVADAAYRATVLSLGTPGPGAMQMVIDEVTVLSNLDFELRC